MHRQRAHYWSCSRFADWLRGTKKPKAETGSGWDKWHNDARSSHKFRYWLAEEGLDWIQNLLHYPTDVFYSIRGYISNRWVFHAHALTAHPFDIKRGQWRDVGNRFLPCLFNELVDFVEVEQASSYVAWNKEEAKQQGFTLPGWTHWLGKWRCPEAGIAHYQWASELTNSEYVDESDPSYGQLTHQAIAAREILFLYNWWKNVYPNRPDASEVSGWSEYCSKRREANGGSWRSILGEDKTESEYEESRKILDRYNQIEKQYTDEDTEMLCRLIKVRDSLWT